MKRRAVSRSEAIGFIRNHGPKTMLQVAERFCCSKNCAAFVIREARAASLLKIIGKDERGQFIIGAVQTQDWPARQQQRAA